MKKKSNFRLMLPLVVTGIFGWADAAKTSTFKVGDQILVDGSFQLQNFFLDRPDSVINFLFVPNLPRGGVSPLGETALARIIPNGNTGAFNIFNDPNNLISALAEVRSFNTFCGVTGGDCDVSGFSADNFFLLAGTSLPNSGGNNYPTKFAFSLDVNSFFADFQTFPDCISMTAGGTGKVLDLGNDGLAGTGDDGNTANVAYIFTACGLRINSPGTTSINTYSGLITVEKSVAESNNTAALIALGALASIGVLYKPKKL